MKYKFEVLSPMNHTAKNAKWTLDCQPFLKEVVEKIGK